MSVAFILNRKVLYEWYNKNYGIGFTGIDYVGAGNQAEDVLYKFAIDNGFRLRKHYNERSKSPKSYWKVEEHEFNLIRIVHGDLIKQIPMPRSSE